MRVSKVAKLKRAFINNMNAFFISISNQKAEGYVDSGIKILISVVIGALLLSGLYTLFDETIMPTVTKRIEEMFKYTG